MHGDSIRFCFQSVLDSVFYFWRFSSESDDAWLSALFQSEREQHSHLEVLCWAELVLWPLLIWVILRKSPMSLFWGLFLLGRSNCPDKILYVLTWTMSAWLSVFWEAPSTRYNCLRLWTHSLQPHQAVQSKARFCFTLHRICLQPSAGAEGSYESECSLSRLSARLLGSF